MRTAGGVESRPVIAADTSTWVNFLEGAEGQDTRLLDKALADRQVVVVPVVLTELRLIEIGLGFWHRAGVL